MNSCVKKRGEGVLSLPGSGLQVTSLPPGVLREPREKKTMVLVVLQQLQLSADAFALSFRSSLMGSGNSLYSSTSVS